MLCLLGSVPFFSFWLPGDAEGDLRSSSSIIRYRRFRKNRAAQETQRNISGKKKKSRNVTILAKSVYTPPPFPDNKLNTGQYPGFFLRSKDPEITNSGMVMLPGSREVNTENICS